MLKLTRRAFIKLIGIIIGIIAMLKFLTENKVNKIKAQFQSSETNISNFNITILHSLGDSDYGKTFIIRNFPSNCTINEIRLRSNLIAGQRRIWTVFVDNEQGLSSLDSNIIYRGMWDSSPVGEYISIDNEIMLIEEDTGNVLIVKRGVKGSVRSFHRNNSPIRILNNGLRIILFKNSYMKLSERLRIFDGLRTWQGFTNSIIGVGSNNISTIENIENIDKYDILLINDGVNSERVTVQDVVSENKEIYVYDGLSLHIPGIEVLKELIFNDMIYYRGDINLYGLLFIDEKIDPEKYPNGIFVEMDIKAIV